MIDWQSRIDALDALSRRRALTDAESLQLERAIEQVEKHKKADIEELRHQAQLAARRLANLQGELRQRGVNQ